MIKVKFNDLNRIFQVSFSKLNDHVVSLVGPFLPANTSGFKTFRMNGKQLGDWSKFTTIYRVIEGGVQFSDDGSIWVEPIPDPEPMPDPTPVDPQPTWQDKTLELEGAIAEMYEGNLNVEEELKQKDYDLEEAIAETYESTLNMEETLQQKNYDIEEAIADLYEEMIGNDEPTVPASGDNTEEAPTE